MQRPLEEGLDPVKLIRGFEDENLFSFAHGVCAAGPPPSGV